MREIFEESTSLELSNKGHLYRSEWSLTVVICYMHMH